MPDSIPEEPKRSYYVEDGPNKGMVADPNEARILAEKEGGVRELEKVRKEEYESGLTEEQRNNLKVMDGLQIKYPNAFVEKYDLKGRKALIFATGEDIDIKRNRLDGWEGYVYSFAVFTKDGVICVSEDFSSGSTGHDLKGVPLEELGDKIYNMVPDQRLNGGPGIFKGLNVLKVDLNDADNQSWLREQFNANQACGERMIEFERKHQESNKAEKILNNL